MHCRQQPTDTASAAVGRETIETKRCAVGKKLTTRCRFAVILLSIGISCRVSPKDCKRFLACFGPNPANLSSMKSAASRSGPPAHISRRDVGSW
jgi:hypothetical protein